MTIRLNNDHRGSLKNLARKIIIQEHKSTNTHTAMLVGIRDYARGLVQKDYPEADLKVLKKYGLVSRKMNLMFQASDAPGDLFHIEFLPKEEEGFNKKTAEEMRLEEQKLCPEVPVSSGYSSRAIAADRKLTEMHRAYEKADKIYRDELNAKLHKYYAVIDHCKTYESLVEIWPEALELQASFNANLPVAISNEIINSVKEESAARLDAAKHLIKAPKKK